MSARLKAPIETGARDEPDAPIHAGATGRTAHGDPPQSQHRKDRSGRARSAGHAQRADIVAAACRRIEAAESPPTLRALAADTGLSPWQFHRRFVTETGLTPRAYAAGVRAQRLRAALAAGDRPVTEAIYEAGFNASSRCYEASSRMLGMRPGDYRAGAPGARIHFAVGQCALGAILVAESPRGLCAILLGDDPDALLRDLQNRFPHAHLTGGDAEFEARVAQVVGFVEMPSLGLDLPLDIRGTAFQERVWQALLAVPCGTTVSYAELAQRVGAPAAVRAVARACGANPLAVAIPCHRVVRIDGGLGGYRWGIDRKRRLLATEGAPACGAGVGAQAAAMIMTET